MPDTVTPREPAIAPGAARPPRELRPETPPESGTARALGPETALPPAQSAFRPLRELRRIVAADAEPRRLAIHATMGQLFLRFDPTHELPHVVELTDGRIVARFEKDADLAWFISRGKTERPTLPEAYVFHLTGGQV